MQMLIIGTFFLLWCLPSMVSAEISLCARWNRTGSTVVDTDETGNSLDDFSGSRSISIHKKTNVLYVSFSENINIRMFLLDQLSTDGNGVTAAVIDKYPERIYVDDDDNGPTIYATFLYPSYIKQWVKGASSGVLVGEGCRSCAGVSVDKEKNVYISDRGRHLAQKWSPRTNTTIVVAGKTDMAGSTNQLLHSPRNIDVDPITGSVYVTDTNNHRIQKYDKDTEEGITVAGSSIGRNGADSSSLKFPEDVLVDDETHVVYVADTYNNRIQKWMPGAFEGSTIAGGLDGGNAANQLSEPSSLAFDNKGNLYVCDKGNTRVQMFQIIDNEPCHNSSTGISHSSSSIDLLTAPQATTTTQNHAISSYWNQHYIRAMIVTTLSIIIWANTMLV